MKIKKCTSIIKKNKKKHVKTVLLAKSKLVRIKVWICKSIIDSNISHDEFALINNMVREYDYVKEGLKHWETSLVYRRF